MTFWVSRILALNVLVFFLIPRGSLVYLLCTLFPPALIGLDSGYFPALPFRPWTALTYMFLHANWYSSMKNHDFVLKKYCLCEKQSFRTTKYDLFWIPVFLTFEQILYYMEISKRIMRFFIETQLNKGYELDYPRMKKMQANKSYFLSSTSIMFVAVDSLM